MRDISTKFSTLRMATAQAVLRALPRTIEMVHNQQIPKGDPLPVAKVAAIQAAKNTSQIIPYCHPVRIDSVNVEYEFQSDAIQVTVTVKSIDKTGVEMEALTAASAAALTMYDMLKMLDESMEILNITLLSKKGGKSDFKQKFADSLNAAVVVISDSISASQKTDRSGRLIVERLETFGVEVSEYLVIPDEPEEIKSLLKLLADEKKVNLIITTGGTGISPRDNTPEATAEILDKEMPGIVEAARAFGQDRTPYSMLSRGKAGTRGDSLIINMPGSTGGVSDSLDALFPGVLHAFKMIWGGNHESAAVAVGAKS